jgi:signal transduction histidine kinase
MADGDGGAASGSLSRSLLASMAHELRGGLNVCVMWLDLLELKASQPDALQQAVEVMRRNLKNQATLIRELDDIAQMLSTGIELECRNLDLASVLGGTASAWSSAAAGRDLRLDAGSATGPGLRVEADPERLLQALNYGFENALLSTPAGGAIGIRLRRVDDTAEIAIKDTGIGLQPEQSAGFFRNPLEGPRRQKALGLHLVIAQHLVERHGGSIDIQSDGPEHGCTLTFRLPAVDQP